MVLALQRSQSCNNHVKRSIQQHPSHSTMVALVDELGLALVLARDACALGAVVSVCLHLKLGKRGSSQTKSQVKALFTPTSAQSGNQPTTLHVRALQPGCRCVCTDCTMAVGSKLHPYWRSPVLERRGSLSHCSATSTRCVTWVSHRIPAPHTCAPPTPTHATLSAAVQHASNKASSPVTAVFNACLGDALVHGYVQDLIVLLCGGLLAFHAFAGRATAAPVEAADAAASEAASAASEAAEAESQEDPLAMAVASGSLLLFIGSLMYNNFEQHGAVSTHPSDHSRVPPSLTLQQTHHTAYVGFGGWLANSCHGGSTSSWQHQCICRSLLPPPRCTHTHIHTYIHTSFH